MRSPPGLLPEFGSLSKLVIQEQKVDSLSADAPANVDAALFEIAARVKNPADIEYVRDRILDTAKNFREKPVDADRLEQVRKHLRYSVALRMQSSDAIARILAQYIALRRTPESMNKLYDQYASLTPDDVQKAAAKYLVDSNRTIVTLTGLREAPDETPSPALLLSRPSRPPKCAWSTCRASPRS